jgi:hypothetical protein
MRRKSAPGTNYDLQFGPPSIDQLEKLISPTHSQGLFSFNAQCGAYARISLRGGPYFPICRFQFSLTQYKRALTIDIMKIDPRPSPIVPGFFFEQFAILIFHEMQPQVPVGSPLFPKRARYLVYPFLGCFLDGHIGAFSPASTYA